MSRPHVNETASAAAHAMPPRRRHAASNLHIPPIRNVRQRLEEGQSTVLASAHGAPAPAAVGAQLHRVSPTLNDDDSTDDDSILAAIESRIRRSRNFGGPANFGQESESEDSNSDDILPSPPDYSADDIAADETDLQYMCPLSLDFATEDPVIFQGLFFERVMLQTYVHSQDATTVNIRHPVHRTPVRRELFLSALQSPASTTLLHQAQDAMNSYESRVERRDTCSIHLAGILYAIWRFCSQTASLGRND
jgi:hypothetical protein